MPHWSRRPTVINGETAQDDYVIIRDGIALGRVHRAPFVQGAPAFTWASWTIPAQQGTADTLDNAAEACRAEIGDKPVPDHIKRQPDWYR